MSAPNLPNALLKFGLALAKHYVKKVIGDEALQEIATTAADISGEEVKAKVDSILGNKEGEKQLLKAAKAADKNFVKKCKDKDFRELFTMEHGDLPSVQNAIANLPKELDDEALQVTLFKVFRAELPKRISDKQVEDGVDLYVKCLQDALLPVKDFGLHVLHSELKEISKDVKDVKAGVEFLVENARIASQRVSDSKNHSRFLVPFHYNPIVEGINLLPYDYDQRIQNFLTEYLGTASQPVPFGGRNDAMRILDTWLADTTPYLLLAAPAGRGKSALLVRWLDNLQHREDIALAFVPVSIRFGTNMERIFYAALAARLAFLHGDNIPTSPETSTAVYRGLVSDYLSKPLANGHMLLVVLDGLDEAADWQAGADFMPAELPAGVRVVVSARLLAGDADSKPWLSRLNWERDSLAFAPALTPLDRAGVTDVLFKMGCPLNELSRNIDIVAELYRLSAGDPLLVSLYVGDLWAKGDEVAQLQPEELARIQPGYKGYFDRWWDDQKKLWRKDKPWLEKHVRAVRNLLSGALGPLFRDDFQALDPELVTDYIADGLEILQRFIIGDNQSQGYTFSHPKLGHYFWDALTKSEQAQVEEAFLVWCDRTFQEITDSKRDPKKKAEAPIYVMRNYGAHLTRANQPIEKWLPFIHHQQWAQAWFTLEGAYGGYSQDVQRVREQCRILDRQAIEMGNMGRYLGQEFRCGLIMSSLHTLAGKVPAELIPILLKEKIWTFPQAWVFIHQMPNDNQRSQAFIAIIPDLEDVQLSEILEAARAIQTDEQRARVISALVQRLPELGKEALKTARMIENDEQRAEVLVALAQHWPKAAAEALEETWAIRHDAKRAKMMITLAQVMPEAVNEVLKVIWVNDEMQRADLLIALAKYLPERVLEMAPLMESDMQFAKVLGGLVQYMPDVAERALKEARTLKYYPQRLEVLSLMAKYLPERVLEVTRKVVDEGNRFPVLIALAEQFPELVTDALKEARQISHKMPRARALIDVAPYLPKIAEEALGVAKAIPYEGERTSALIALAQARPEMARKVLKALQMIDDGEQRANMLIVLMQHLPEVAEEAYEMIKKIKIRDKRDLLREAKKALSVARRIKGGDVLTKEPGILTKPLIIKSVKHYNELENALISLSNKERYELYLNITVLLPIFSHYAIENIGEDILQAVRDVTTWWP